MEKVLSISKSFEESDRRDKEYYRGLTPRERLAILLELNSRWPAGEDAEAILRLQRVYRIIEFA